MPFGNPPPDDSDTWRFPARVERVVDGDTLDMTVDLGFYISRTTRFRLTGVDTAEIYGVSHDSDEFAEGTTHGEFVAEWVHDHDGTGGPGEWPLVAWTNKDTGKFGRYVADVVHRESGTSLTAALIDEFGDDVRNDPDA